MSRATTAKEVLVAARWILDTHGWIQGQFSRFSDMRKPVGFCMIGAINMVEYDSVEHMEVWQCLIKVIRGNSIFTWNDNPKRTKKQVLKAFDKAIKACP